MTEAGKFPPEPPPAAVTIIGQLTATADLTVTSAAETAADADGNVADG